MRKLKVDVESMQKKSNSETKEQIESNTEAVKSIDMKINQLSQNIQALHLYVRNNATESGTKLPPKPKPIPQTPPPQPKLPKPQGERLDISPGGPKDFITGGEPPAPKIVKIEEPMEVTEEPVCDEESGICIPPSGGEVASIDSVPIQTRSKMVHI